MRDNEGRGNYVKTITTHSKPKDQSEMSKFVLVLGKGKADYRPKETFYFAIPNSDRPIL